MIKHTDIIKNINEVLFSKITFNDNFILSTSKKYVIMLYFSMKCTHYSVKFTICEVNELNVTTDELLNLIRQFHGISIHLNNSQNLQINS